VSIDCHFVLKLAEMKEGVGGFRVVVEGGHHKLFWEIECGDFPASGESEGLNPLVLYSFPKLLACLVEPLLN